MPRIYYKEEKIAGQAIDTEFISLALFDYVFNNTDSRIFNYSELSNSYLVNMPSGNNLTFKKIELRKDGIYYNSAKGKLYLPSAIIFYDEKDFNFPSEFYFIAKVGNEIELRKCKGGKDIEWFHIPELHEAVDDPEVISKIENTLRELKIFVENFPKAAVKATSKTDHQQSLSDEQRAAYRELTNLCVYNKPDNLKIQEMIDTIENYDGDDEYFTTLNYFLDLMDDEDIPFIMRMDLSAGVEDLEWLLSSCLKNHPDITVKLPTAAHYNGATSVSADHVLADFDRPLREKGLQLGFIDTESDEYIMVLHKIKDKDSVEKAVKSIGYKYFDMEMPR